MKPGIKKRPYAKQPKFMPKKMLRVSGSQRGEEEADTYKITSRKIARIGQSKIGLGQQPYYVRAYKSEKVHEIMSELHNAGLNVEEPGSASRKTVTVSGHIGKPLLAAFRGLSEKRKNRLMLDAFELLGKIHAQNVKHGHPHVENIVVSKGKVGFIDFRMAEKVKVNWNSAQDIDRKFWRDYAFIAGKFTFAQKINTRLLEAGFARLVAQYPCSAEVKTSVLAVIKALLIEGEGLGFLDRY